MRLAGRMLLALGGCFVAIPGAAAQALGASIHPSFAPDRLGARTAFTFSFRLGSAETGVPPPLSRIVVHLPAGLAFDVGGVATCAPSRLQRSGPAGCPARSLIGRGHAVLEVHAGSQAIPEEAAVWALRAPDRGGHTALAIFGQGETPLLQRTISTAVLAPDRGPYGSKLTVSIPPIPTVVYEPNASIISFSLTLGAARARPRAHAAGAITVPRRCSGAGFPFAAEFAFADYTSARASARIRCP